MKQRTRHLINRFTITTSFLLAACGGADTVVFVTGTDIGIVQVDGVTQSGSIGYDRAEGVITPAFKDGQVPPVYGAFETDGGIFNPQIKQVHATGKAARIASGANEFAGQRDEVSEFKKNSEGTKRMFFGTNTSTGLNLTMSNARPANFSFGFKRQELSVIPLMKGDEDDNAKKDSWFYAPVIGSIEISTSTASVPTASIGVEQFFATGDAAEVVSSYGDIVTPLRERQDEQENPEQNQ